MLAAEHCDTGVSAAHGTIATSAVFTHHNNPETNSGPEMIRIRGGEFLMGSDHPDMEDARPVHSRHVGAFWMDRTLVTNDQFAQFGR